VCDRETRFSATDARLRDHYRCELCGSIPRERALACVLQARFPDWRRLRIHESSPGTPLSRRLAQECPGYLPTHFFPGVAGGTMKDGYRCEDLGRQTFPDGSFDLVISLDVMEHVIDPDAAFREIARTLAPGGAHVFTTSLEVHRGHDVRDLVLRASGLTTTIHEIRDPSRGIEGEPLQVFVSSEAPGRDRPVAPS
jgi:SAM-dependent methyltransferase